jgi:hypothetical protein
MKFYIQIHVSNLIVFGHPGGGGRKLLRKIVTCSPIDTTSYPAVLEFLPTSQQNLKFRVNLELLNAVFI